jgi:hypothetical protein
VLKKNEKKNNPEQKVAVDFQILLAMRVLNKSDRKTSPEQKVAVDFQI